ncbi:MAG: hypothetical protein QOF02_2574 [Blastocatellia bacterium]|jgi:hypothetical protein|nr:hypothetical protein [Blastocatellia bacterium]
MTKKIFTVGFDIPGDDTENISFRSEQSLLDADIIVFEPSFVHEYSQSDYFKGKPKITESDSFDIVEDTSHWMSELKAAFDSGKTIFIFLPRLEEVFRYTGEKQFSGTGKNRATTNIVAPFNNYEVLPIRTSRIVPKSGREIRVAKDLRFLSNYWREFGKDSVYEVYLEGDFKDVILTTKAGDKVVGAIIEGPKGAMILLPPLRYDPEPLFTKSGKNWNTKGIAFGKRLTAILVEIDKTLRGNRGATPSPEWTKNSEYRLDTESDLENKIKDVTQQIEDLNSKRRELFIGLEREGGIRRLLYERGAQLEEAILDALRTMGFKAENFKESESEFDAIFSSEEGRFLGEAEGKDNKAINIDKLSQLERNIQEDFAREEVAEFAKGVLFGNAHRLSPLSERSEYFTQKCISGAQRLRVALVRTPDLFIVSKYLKEHDDPSFAKSCRAALLKAEGEIVQFPTAPFIENLEEEIELEQQASDKSQIATANAPMLEPSSGEGNA